MAAAVSLTATSCATSSWTARQKTAAGFVLGTVAGAGIGYALHSSNKDSNLSGTIATNALIGNVVGGGIGFYMAKDKKPSDEVAALRRELELYKQAGTLPDQKYNVEAYNFQQSKASGELLPYVERCTGEILKLCPTGEDGLGNCKTPQVATLNRHWALQYVAYLSPQGCFDTTNLSIIPGITEYLDNQFDLLNTELKKEK